MSLRTPSETVEKLQTDARGRERWLEMLRKELTSGQYVPQPLLRVWIPKSNGGQRPLGIPCIRDRVVQMAAVLIIGPSLSRTCCPSSMASDLEWAPRWLSDGSIGT